MAPEKLKENMTIKVPSMQDLLEAGVHFGHQVRRGHPKMSPYIFGARDGVHIIDLGKSEEKLQEAARAAYEIGKKGGVMLLVGTKKQAREIIEGLAKEAELPFLTQHWVGGLLTNFEEIQKNIKKLVNLKEEQQKGALSRYTKKEQLLIARKLGKFDTVLGGVADMKKLPDAMFIVDAQSDNTAVKEAMKMGIPILGLCDTNADPNWFDWPVPANDDGIKSIKLICETLINTYTKGKKEAKDVAEKEQKAKESNEIEVELAPAVKEEAAAIEEEIEKKVVEESERKTG